MLLRFKLIAFISFIVITASMFVSMLAPSSALAAESRPIAVLVPGFFNSLTLGYFRIASAPVRAELRPYFSIAIIHAFENNGVEPVVVDTLSPVGTLEDNGERLIKFLDALKANPHYAGRPLHLVGHSAGGLYSFYAIAKRPNYGIKSLSTLGTPFAGVEFVGKLASGIPGLEDAVKFIDLRSLPQLEPGNVSRFINGFDLPKNFVIKVFAGHQTFGFNLTDARNLSWPLATVSTLIGKPSDGIVSVDSAYATGILTHSQGPLPIQRATQLIPLEHWEQCLDYRVFGLLGILNATYIRDAQTNFYGSLAKNIRATH